ncbi:hypothetical protein N0V93_007711 [Gnomoniopsis smithogilvyi]|uniref:Uncharacterized protein n=1 Tax=Gnomoniopsis smithogilvyi TaxID=1191159 RepID=A0A9W9CU33_9PEZI|nr:hypothetical protein N0V93_007711 [Gnomoniopsis smithogilvyi]
MAVQAYALADMPTTNENTATCTGSCVTHVDQENQGGDDGNSNDQNTDCYGSCVTYVTQEEADAGDDTQNTKCNGSCVTYVEQQAPAARRFYPGSHERRRWTPAGFQHSSS